jgi:hypothetical protein
LTIMAYPHLAGDNRGADIRNQNFVNSFSGLTGPHFCTGLLIGRREECPYARERHVVARMFSSSTFPYVLLLLLNMFNLYIER